MYLNELIQEIFFGKINFRSSFYFSIKFAPISLTIITVGYINEYIKYETKIK